jgi:hypothetical protein
MVQEFAGQAGAFAKLMLAQQLLGAAAGRKIKRIPLTHLAGKAELMDQRPQPDDRAQACKISTRCPLKAVSFRKPGEGTVDFPQQHRGAGGGAAAAGQLAIDEDDIEALARQALGDQRSCNAAAHDQRVAFQALGYIEAGGMPARRKPR